MSLFTTLILFAFYSTNSEVIDCNGNCACRENFGFAPGETCTLNCAEDRCKSSTLKCGSGRPCNIYCTKDTSCADYTDIDAKLSTDVNIMCNGNDACKSYLNIQCGTGDCLLSCGPGTSCEEMDPTLIDITRSHSFICSNCPPSIANLQFTMRPTKSPSKNPTYMTRYPSIPPTKYPTFNPSISPTKYPTKSPTNFPTKFPTISPTKYPTLFPTKYPTTTPTKYPTYYPTYIPTSNPTNDPTSDPTNDPTYDPTYDPSKYPTNNPSKYPSIYPTNDPTNDPSTNPTVYPSYNPSTNPTIYPTIYPTQPSIKPTYNPTIEPTTHKPTTYNPTINPTTNIIIDTKDINLLYNPNKNVFDTNTKDNNSNSEGVLISVLLISIVIISIVSIVTVWWYRKKAFISAMNRLERVDSIKTIEDSDEKQLYVLDGNYTTKGMNEQECELQQDELQEDEPKCDEGEIMATYAIRMHYNGKRFNYELNGKDVIETGACEWDEHTFQEIKYQTKKKFGVDGSYVQLYEIVGDCPIDIDDMDDIVCSFYDTNRKSIDIFVKAENDVHYVDELELAQKTPQ